MKTYTYEGYRFRKSRITTDVRGRGVVQAYEIDDLKSPMTRPFLTTIEDCKEYIREVKRPKI